MHNRFLAEKKVNWANKQKGFLLWKFIPQEWNRSGKHISFFSKQMTQVQIFVPFICINDFFFLLHLPPVPHFSTEAGQDVYEQPHTLKPDYLNQLTVPRLQFIISPLFQRLLLQLFTLQTSPLASHQSNKSLGDSTAGRNVVTSRWGVCLPSKMTSRKEQGPVGAQKALTSADRTQFGLEVSQLCIRHRKVWKGVNQKRHWSPVLSAVKRSPALHTK